MAFQTRTWETDLKLLSNLTEALNQDTGGNNEKLARALRVGAYDSWTQFFTDLDPQLTRQTATSGRLSAILSGFGVPSTPSDDDVLMRSRIAARLAIMWNDSTPSGVIDTAVAVSGLQPEDFDYYENLDSGTGDYSPAYAELVFDAGALLAAGIPAADLSSVIDEITEAVNQTAPAGYRINTLLTTGAVWGDPATIWDDPATLWSS